MADRDDFIWHAYTDAGNMLSRNHFKWGPGLGGEWFFGREYGDSEDFFPTSLASPVTYSMPVSTNNLPSCVWTQQGFVVSWRVQKNFYSIANDGSIQWTRPFSGTGFHVVSSVAYDPASNTLMVSAEPSGSTGDRFFFLDPSNGNILSSTDAGFNNFTPPRFNRFSDNGVACICDFGQRDVAGISTSGVVQWSNTLSALGDTISSSSSPGGQHVVLNARGSFLNIYNVEVFDSSGTYQTDFNVPTEPNHVVAGQYIYTSASTNSEVSAYDYSGNQIWSINTAAELGSGFFGAAFHLGPKGDLYIVAKYAGVLRVKQSDGSIVWKSTDFMSHPNNTPTGAAVRPSDGRVAIMGDEHIQYVDQV